MASDRARQHAHPCELAQPDRDLLLAALVPQPRTHLLVLPWAARLPWRTALVPRKPAGTTPSGTTRAAPPGPRPPDRLGWVGSGAGCSRWTSSSVRAVPAGAGSRVTEPPRGAAAPRGAGAGRGAAAGGGQAPPGRAVVRRRRPGCGPVCPPAPSTAPGLRGAPGGDARPESAFLLPTSTLEALAPTRGSAGAASPCDARRCPPRSLWSRVTARLPTATVTLTTFELRR